MIIGLTGTLGAGKGTVVEYLAQKKGFKHFAVSDTLLAGEAVKRGLEATRLVRQQIANEYRAKGPTKLQEAVYDMARADIEAGHDVFIEPQHTVAEVQFIQSIGGKVISVDANLRIRYDRIKLRGSAKDNVSFEEFEKIQKEEMASDNPNKNNLAAAIAVADFHVTNDGSFEELHAQIDDVLRKISE
ncbi:MAG: AAA family ATPase [Minisyncoccia bacterium]